MLQQATHQAMHKFWYYCCYR